MTFKEALELLKKIAKDNNLSEPFLVGGVPRDFLLGHRDFSDFDITTGDDDVNTLAKLFAEHLGKEPLYTNEHFSVIVDDMKFDFAISHSQKNSTDTDSENSKWKEEALSRDFTINTLMMPLDMSKVIDPTGKGKEDLESGILRCPIDCKTTLEADPRRILRAFHFKGKYGFKFSDELNKAINESGHLLKRVNQRYAAKMINKIIRCDENILDEFIKTGLISWVPITKLLSKKLIEKKYMADALEMQANDGFLMTNFDYSARQNSIRDVKADSEKAKTSKKLPVLNKSAVIRGPQIRECPFGLPIAVACKNAGSSVERMTPLTSENRGSWDKIRKCNKRVYWFHQEGSRCIYADKIVFEKDRVHCDYGDSGAGLRDAPLRPSPFYPRVFQGLGQYGLYSYPIYDYEGYHGARDIFTGIFSLYAATGEVMIMKNSVYEPDPILKNVINDIAINE